MINSTMTATTLDNSSTFLTVADVCEALNISRQTFYARQAKRGHFPSHKVGRRVYFAPEILTSTLALPG